MVQAVNSKTLTSRLALFFTAISVVIGAIIFALVIGVLRWSEDRVGERRISIDRDAAIERFLDGEQGAIQVDKLTVAYNDLSKVPVPYQEFLQDKENFVGEVGDYLEPLSHMVYKGSYIDRGVKKPIVLLTLIDAVEFGAYELFWAGFLILGVVCLLMVTFGTLLHRLSKHLIEPLNELSYQLENKSGDVKSSFTINEQAAQEFQLLTKYLNTYRSDLDKTLKREQAFARYASHELRTPLTIVTGATKLLTKQEVNDFQSRQLVRIGDATNQMITMVDALLSIVRYEKSVDSAPPRSFDKDEMMDILALNSQHAISKNNRVCLEFISEPQVRATPAVMNMLIGNLLRNAYAATQDGQVNVSVHSNQIEIKDNGSGLSKGNSEGHGLGLMIVEDLCQRYQWAFNLSENDKGCTATIKLSDSVT
ncbi:two-component system sensor protein [Vibrio ishigakensis]|uniref:histidine kinase n=1 Tax=Vibrio ishigakensis TaxID=1481914 RepID=A0A0B8Q6U9_9VIBR|nr:two-component system sensor protein [Vibrio ishigakensis]